MTGLNPDGVGKNTKFNNTESTHNDTTTLYNRRLETSRQDTRNLGVGSPGPLPGTEATMADVSNWSALNTTASATQDSSDSLIGGNSLLIDNGGTGDAGVAYDWSSQQDLTDLFPDFAINVETPLDQTLTVNCRYYEGDGAGGFTGNWVGMQYNYDPTTGGTDWVRIHPSLVNDTSTPPDLTSITRVRIHIDDPGECIWKLDDFRFVEGPGEGRVLWMFDDTRQEAYNNALPVLDRYGQYAVQGVITESIGTENSMTMDQLIEWYEKGHACINHFKDWSAIHEDNISPDEWEKGVREAKRWLLGDNPRGYEFLNGQSGFALPQGQWDEEHLNRINKYHDLCFNTTGPANAGWAGRCNDAMLVTRGAGTNPTGVNNLLDLASRYGQVVNPFIHRVGGSDPEMSVSDFENIVSTVDQNSNLKPISYADLVNYALPRRL